MANRLSESSSPYLRQHLDNPVDWFPWCEEAFSRAKEEDKPIFLSVGYSACHWCHVMAHESFENEELATILNEHFVSIKVDREERPDVDQIYMQAVQMLTGSGGWPMSIFMAPDGRPFYGGTYWPPDSRWGRPGFGQVLLAVADAWKNKRDQIDEQGRQLTEHLQTACRGPEAANTQLSEDWIQAADRWLQQNHDPQHGGFGGAPKFPHAMDLLLLIDLSVPTPDQDRAGVVRHTLTKMAQGGIYDHLGGGFARYSVDERWLVPHFEKMLYDNALLASTYANAFRLWGDEADAHVLRETLDYVLRDMTHPAGGYYSAEDADSEGVEGKFYVWSLEEMEEVLGKERAPQFGACYDVTAHGNFEGSNILHLSDSIYAFADQRQLDPQDVTKQLAEDRAKLLQRRNSRVRPGLDDKVLLSWNALAITSMVHGYRATGESRFLDSARKAIDFLITHLQREDGRFWHTWRDGKPSLDAYLDDYAYLLDALVEFFQVDAQVSDLQLALDLAEILLRDFRDPQGGFFFTANGHEPLIARSKDLADNSVPSGNAMAASGLLTLARLTARQDLLQASESALLATSGVMSTSPQAAGQALRVLHRFLNPSQEWVLVSPPRHQQTESDEATQRQLLHRFDPYSVTILSQGPPSAELQSLCPLLRDRTMIDHQTTLYVCRNSACQTPLRGDQLVDFMASIR